MMTPSAPKKPSLKAVPAPILIVGVGLAKSLLMARRYPSGGSGGVPPGIGQCPDGARSGHSSSRPQ